MDYEREAESDLGQPPSEPDAPSNGVGENPTANEDLGTESALLSDSTDAMPAPPEWPAADLEPRAADLDSMPVADEPATATAAQATDTEVEPMGDADEPVDLGDDSDAPVQLDGDMAVPAGLVAVDGHVKSENLDLSQGGVQSIEATTVTLSQGGAGQVHAETMSIEQGGVGLARVSSLTLGSGASAFAVVADQATVEEGSNAFLVVSRSFTGDVRPTIDWRGAMAFGAGLGLVLSIMRRLR